MRVTLPMLLACALISFAIPAAAQTRLFEVEKSDATKLLQVQDDAGLVVRGTHKAGAIPATGPGVRLMWYPRKAAFRVGQVGGDQWDDANVGALSELGEFRAIDSIVGSYVRRLEGQRGTGQTGGVIASMYGTNKLRLGELDSAETWIARAARDSSDIGRNVVAKMWLPPSLMQLRLDQGRPADARRMVGDLPQGTPLRQMNDALLRAHLRRVEGDVRGSRLVLDSALRTAPAGPRPPTHLTLGLVTTAEWHLADRDWAGTDSLARLAIAAAASDSLAFTRSGYVGRAELLRARAALAAGDARAAAQAANRAVIALGNGYGRHHPRSNEARRLRDSLPH